MCKQIRYTYYCEELFLINHKSKHTCESVVFYNLTSSVVYLVCEFDYYYNMMVTPCELDGSSHLYLANILCPRQLFCSHDFHMALSVPSSLYILINRSLSCNCHLESGLTYLLKSLGSCFPIVNSLCISLQTQPLTIKFPLVAYPEWMCHTDNC